MKRWLIRLGGRLRRLTRPGEPPERTALAFALGVFIAFTPTLGLHFLGAWIVGWLFRLNFAALFAGTALNNPLTIAPLYGFCLWIGVLLVGGDEPREPIDWSFSWGLLEQLQPWLLQFVLGTLLVGAIVSGLSYWLFLRLAQQRLRKRALKKGASG
jgi:hypothetical protein